MMLSFLTFCFSYFLTLNALQYRPFWLAKEPTLGGEMGFIVAQNGRFRNLFFAFFG